MKFIKFLIIFGIVSSLYGKENLPSYQDIKKITIEDVKNHFPLAEEDYLLFEFPVGQRVLRKIENQQFVYYYQYKIQIPVYERKEISFQKKMPILYREEILWVRIFPFKKTIDITFLHQEYLPGDYSVWIE